MSQNYNYPSSSDVTITGSPNGIPIPSTSLVVGGENAAGNTEPLQLDSAGNLKVSLTGDTTELDVNLTEVGGVAVTLGQKTSAASIPVVLGSDEIVPISATALPLPTGAATSANQTTEIASLSTIVTNTTGLAVSANQTNGTQKTQIVDGSGSVIASTSNALNVDVINFPATQPISGSVTVVQPTGTNLHTVIDSGSVSSTPVTPAARTVNQAALSVGVTAVRLTVSGSAPASTRIVLVATPDSASTAVFYIGSSTVTNSGATRGIEIQAGQSFTANNDAGDYWIVASTAAQTVTVMEQE